MLACAQLLLVGNTYHSTSIHGKLGSTPYLSVHPSLQPGKNYKTIKYLYRHFGKNIGFFLATACPVYKECHFAIPVPHSLCVSMFDYDTYDVNQAVAKTSYTAVSTALGCVARAWSVIWHRPDDASQVGGQYEMDYCGSDVARTRPVSVVRITVEHPLAASGRRTVLVPWRRSMR